MPFRRRRPPPGDGAESSPGLKKESPMRRTFEPADQPRTFRRLLAAAAVLSLSLLLAGSPGARGGEKGGEKGGKKPPAGGQPKIGYEFNQMMGFGLVLIDKAGDKQRINYDPRAGTSMTFVMVDGKLYFFGAKEDDKLPPGLRGGRWEVLKKDLGKDPEGKARLGHQST